ncbi:hypothetical protein Tco_1291970 [Tanacetum coccineum]
MVRLYLEKTDGNTEFHEIISFLTRSSIHYALTVSLVVSTTFVEQFWMSAKSKLINNVRYITAKVAGKLVSISEASIRSDLLFNNADGIDSLPNQAIFDAIHLIGLDEGTVDQTEGRSATPTTPTPTPTIFGDDETIAQVLLNISQAKAVSREKEKGVELKDVENIERPRPTSTRSLLTLKPLLKIDPKDKGKKKIEEDEFDIESKDINESEKKFKMLAYVEEIEADRLLALRLQEEEREQFTMEERAKFLHDTIAAQRRFLAEQRAAAIRNRPPTRTQLRSQMMTYLKHVGNKKHSDLKNKTFEEIQALYEKVKRFDESFTVIGSTEDERKIKEMNEGASDPDKKKKFVKEDVLTKVPAEPDVAEQGTKKRKGGHMKMIARKRKRPQPDVDSDDEHRKCLKIVTFEGTIDSEIMERKSVIARLNKVSSPDGDYLVITKIWELQGIQLSYGDLKIMMESSTEENDQSDFWNNQQNWEIVRWRLYEACGVYILRIEDGHFISYVVKEDLIRFIKQQLNEEVKKNEIKKGLVLAINNTINGHKVTLLIGIRTWLVHKQTALLVPRSNSSGKDYSKSCDSDCLLKNYMVFNAPCYGNEALLVPKANELTIPEQTATGKGISNLFMAGRRIAKDVKETLRSYQDLSDCLNTYSMKFKESTPKKHEVKQVQQSCLGEDCWELYIPDLVPLVIY